MQPYLGRFAFAFLITVPLLGCHGRSKDRGGLVNVRTRDGVHVRAPFVNVDVATPSSETPVDAGPALVPPPELISPDGQ